MGCPADENEVVGRKMFDQPPRPFTPRPSETVHSSTDSAWKRVENDSNATYSDNKSETKFATKNATEAATTDDDAESVKTTDESGKVGICEKLVKPGAIVFMEPKPDPSLADNESGIGEMDERDEELERRMNMQLLIDDIYQDGSFEPNHNFAVQLGSMDELCSIVVGAVMKKVLSELLSVSESTVLQDKVIRKIYPQPTTNLSCIDFNSLDRFYIPYDKNEMEVGYNLWW